MLLRLISKLYKAAAHGTPFALFAARSSMERWRYRAFSVRYAALSPVSRLAIGSTATLLHPVVSAHAVWKTSHEQRGQGRAMALGDALRMYALAVLRNVPPVEYAFYGFSDPAKRRLAPEYLYWMDTPALLLLNSRRGADNADVQDKARFAAICHAASLPHVETLAVFRRGQRSDLQAFEAIFTGDIWVKPLTGNGAVGSMRWTPLGGGEVRSGNGDVLQRAAFLERLSTVDCIVQRPVVNHPELDRITNGSAAVLRVVTALSRSGEAHVLSAGIALPFGTSQTTQGAKGHFLNLDGGIMLASDSDDAGVHPDTGEPTTARAVPHWAEVKELVLRAHRTAFSCFATLGWDVVVTPEGPKLLETNSGWAAIGVQMHYGPLGLGPLGQMVAEELSLAT